MDFVDFLWMTFGIFLTMATFSFLYKDNPFYKLAEHLVVGVSAGFFVIILWHNTLVPNLFQKLEDGDWYFLFLNSSEWWYIIPAILGVLMWTRFSKKYSWVSRWPMGLYIGISTGIAIPLEMANRVNKQLFAMMKKIEWDSTFLGVDSITGGIDLLSTASGFAQVLIFFGTISALIYFFFSKEHKGIFGGFATFGIWILMIGFGASFGFTVMARISLFINRMQDTKAWGVVAFNGGDIANPNYGTQYQIVFWVFTLLVVGYIVNEIVQHLKTKKA